MNPMDPKAALNHSADVIEKMASVIDQLQAENAALRASGTEKVAAPRAISDEERSALVQAAAQHLGVQSANKIANVLTADQFETVMASFKTASRGSGMGAVSSRPSSQYGSTDIDADKRFDDAIMRI